MSHQAPLKKSRPWLTGGTINIKDSRAIFGMDVGILNTGVYYGLYAKVVL